jgi:peptidoglycan/LPS O-acetylase OafA/YrhL
VLGLAGDGGGSLTGRLLRTGPLQLLGRISLATYLLHFPVRGAGVENKSKRGAQVRDLLKQGLGQDVDLVPGVVAATAATMVLAALLTLATERLAGLCRGTSK